ncbi:homoserine kinase [Marinactinospora rubrisoli]|uniref:Homoserine kinase n=1 Tax=Marinactinospora rubrisoli TaxID=2715399 RepID=A0ABW2KA65_9ACTN
MPQPRRSEVRVRTPATSANLGPGFDALGLALALHDEVTVRLRDDDRVTVRVEGEGAGEVPTDASHLVVRALHTAFEAAGESPPGLDLHCRNHIPHGRGLGSSASAIVAGVTAAEALLGAAPADGFDRDRVFRLAADIEGHPDNVAPCVYGGFTVAWRDAEAWRALSMAPSARLLPVACVPDQRLSTERARGLLPAAVPHADAAFTAGRAALLVAAVTARPELLLTATEDRLHQPYRGAAMPASIGLVRDLRERDGVAAVISGAGPTVLALGYAPEPGSPGPEAAASPDLPQISGELADSIGNRTGTGWHIRPLRIDPAGVCISSPRS